MASHRPLKADIAHAHFGIDAWRCRFRVVDVFSRRWSTCAFSPSALPGSAVHSVLAAVEGTEPDQTGECACAATTAPSTVAASPGRRWASLETGAKHGPILTVNRPRVQEGGGRPWHKERARMGQCAAADGHIESFHNTSKRDYIHRRTQASRSRCGQAGGVGSGAIAALPRLWRIGRQRPACAETRQF